MTEDKERLLELLTLALENPSTDKIVITIKPNSPKKREDK